MKYFSTFTGIGGFEKGIEQAYDMGHKPTDEVSGQAEPDEDLLQMQQWEALPEMLRNDSGVRITDQVERGVLPADHGGKRPVCIGYSEIDKYACQIYAKHYPEHKNYGDITKIDPDTLPDFDLFVGGFPCQAFSIAGKRRGFDDTRGTLFFDVARILKAKKPKHFVLENVKGLLSHDSGNTFKTIISTLAELGYGVEWQVLNSKNFGVPQNRERVFIVGHLGGFGGRQVFPIRSTDETFNGNTEITQLNNPIHSNDRVYGISGIAPTLNTMQGGRRQPKIVGGLQGHQTAKEDGVSPTLTTAMGQGGGQTPIVWSDEIRIRRLTPTECERLQGFPDGWTDGVSDTQRYKCCGNAVTVNVVQAVMERLLFKQN